MRYTIEKEQLVKELAEEGRSLEYIMAKTSLSKKVICTWCPELRPHDDIIKQSVKQRYHSNFPDFEARITTAFSPFITEDISDDDWEELNNIVYKVLFDLAVYVFRNAITDLPNFSDKAILCDEPYLQYCKNFWDFDNSEYIKERNKEEQLISREYAKNCYDTLHYWSFLKNKKVKDITEGDLQMMQEKLVEQELSPSRIYFILRAGIVPLRYAQEKGWTLSSISDFKMPKKTKKANNTIPDELAEKLFSEKWDNELAYYANLLAYYGHLKLNELKALMVGELMRDNNIKIECIWTDDDDIERSNHPRSFILPKKYYLEFSDFIIKNKYLYEDFIFVDGKKRNTWNDELKKQAARYSDREVNFAMWSS